MNIDASEVAQRLGITIPTLRRMRKELLIEGADWVMDGNRVLISENGVEKLRASFAAPEPLAEKPAAAPTLPQDASESDVRSAVVVSFCRVFNGKRRHFPNPFVIQAKLDTGEKVFVRVKHSEKYGPRCRDGSPMVIQIRPGGTGWVAVGRAPRFPGRW